MVINPRMRERWMECLMLYVEFPCMTPATGDKGADRSESLRCGEVLSRLLVMASYEFLLNGVWKLLHLSIMAGWRLYWRIPKVHVY